MKTTEQKALAYDEAVRRARVFYEMTDDTTGIQSWLSNVFPELKESEDERIRKAILVLVDAHAQGMYKEEMLAWLEKQGMQKQILANSAKTCKVDPSEWSEEDEEELNKIIAHFDWTGNNRFTKDDCEWAQYWLKSFKDRVVPKQEWSEEDEKAIKDLINIVEAYYSLRIYKTREKELLDWLKSLRPQNHWKPSDEQMKVLFKYAEQNNSDGYVLTSLYNNLKKLKD